MTRSRFPRYVWGVLVYNLGVILWGAYVRASSSGAGCGAHWPLCDGVVIPTSKNVALLIEFTHRLSSGLVIPLTGLMLFWALRAFPKRSPVRLGAGLAFLFTWTEAFVGAGLVLFKLVEHNASVYRAVAISAHLVNTFLLLASITLTAYWASGGTPPRIKGQGAVGWGLMLGLLGVLLLGVSGTIAALGDTLFPARSLAEALRQDMSPTAHFLIRLRLFHPLIAVSVGFYLLAIAGILTRLRPSSAVRLCAQALAVIFFLQLGLGLLNVNLLAPIALQMVHLLVADLLWITLILLTASALAKDAPRGVLDEREPAPKPVEPHLPAEPVGWKAYLSLTKPRVISLLLFTTLTAMVIAKGGWPGTLLFLAVAVGGYMAAGSANAINMVIDRDIDGRMKRTSRRPTVTQRIPSHKALLFAIALEAGSFVILSLAANVLSALLALAGLAFYVIVYTVVLKRRTWHNIVIGGAAGAFPPLVGWAAVTGNLSPLAWYLFAIIFVWTPVHFWALALLIKEDYAKAGVPMLPVVLGERVTVLQIALYAILTAAISVIPLFLGEVRWVYLAASVLLNTLLLFRSLQLYQEPSRPRAVTLYKYSMLYLALLFLMMAVDRSIWTAHHTTVRTREPIRVSVVGSVRSGT